ncbi:MAG: ATP-binding protein [Erysipelotrichaceae bacterium]|nr:ATP-binding protein [Erysipelotrichaceae bacterium]
MKVTVDIPSVESRELSYDHNVSVEGVLNDVSHELKYPVFLCKLDNVYRGLSHEVHHDCHIELLDLRNSAAWATYQNSLILIFIKAVHDTLNKDVRIDVGNSFNKGTYVKLNRDVSEEDVRAIEKRMKELVEWNLPIKKEHMSKKQAINLAYSLRQKETAELLKSITGIGDIEIYSLADEFQIFCTLLVPSTGYCGIFELVKYAKGLLIRYPHPSDPLVIPEYEDQKLLYQAFQEADKWGDLLGIQYVSDLNKRILNKSTKEMYQLQEALHEKKISDLADDICSHKKRVVLICGPSSSGKTTFAKRLCIQLKVNGHKTMYMGTDDYFVEDDQAPYDENGERDYESIRAIDTRLFVDNVKDLLAGKETDLPTYSFTTHTKSFGDRLTKIDQNTILVIEGIHALNRQLTDGIPEEMKYKIYISPFTPISIDHHNRISATDCRLLRRMIRDHKFRNWSCAETINAWPKVRNGEDNNIFPFHHEADVFFNSNCIYEFAVIKKYLEPLLGLITREQPEYAEAQRLLGFLKYFDAADDDDIIVNTSIIREFIGGSAIA